MAEKGIISLEGCSRMFKNLEKFMIQSSIQMKPKF